MEERTQLIIGCLCLSILFISCTKKFKEQCFPPEGTATVTITAMDLFDCYNRVDGSGNTKIRLKGVATTHYTCSNGQRYPMGNGVEFTSPANPTSLPITFNINIPTSGAHWEIEVQIDGEECSECANGAGATFCGPRQLVSGGYTGGIPRWTGGTSGNSFQANISLNTSHINRDLNKSCGCTVPF